jgi:DNA-directed RNA polymerase subunit RPC12/RpoP
VVKIKIDFKCPGIDQNLKAIPKLYSCLQCGAEVEIWTDETKGKCPSCKSILFQEQT